MNTGRVLNREFQPAHPVGQPDSDSCGRDLFQIGCPQAVLVLHQPLPVQLDATRLTLSGKVNGRLLRHLGNRGGQGGHILCTIEAGVRRATLVCGGTPEPPAFLSTNVTSD